MSVLVIGGDRIKAICKKLEEKGFDEINHVTGRKKNDIKLDISDNTDLVLILTDFIGHTLCKKIKKELKQKDVTTIFARRSWTTIEKELNNTF